MLNNIYYIHVGVPKSGTTFLQRFVFNNIQNTKFEELNNFNFSDSENLPCSSLYEYIFGSNQIMYSEEVNRKIFDNVRNHFESPGINKYILSRESLTHHEYNHELIVKKLKFLFPNAKIIISIRNQKEILFSKFLWHLKSWNHVFYAKKNNSFNKFIVNEFSDKNYKFRIRNSINYHNVIKNYEKYFGQENILIILYEDLKNNKNKLINKLEDFIGEKVKSKIDSKIIVNQSISLLNHYFNYFRQLFIPSIINLFLEKIINFQNFFIKNKFKFKNNLSEKNIKIIESYYSKYNSYIFKNYDKDISKYNYPLEINPNDKTNYHKDS